jgi:hypothetical protein
MIINNWPSDWSNRIGIIGVPYARRVKGNWFLKVFYLDLEQNSYESKSCELPLEMASYLRVGTEVGPNFTITKESGIIKDITISNLTEGSIIKLSNWNKNLYKFELVDEFRQESWFYKIIFKEEIYLIFCYELFRRFFLNASFLSSYMMSPPEMHLLMDSYNIENLSTGEERLNIQFNKEVPKSVLTEVFIKQFALTNFHPQIKSFWDNIIKAQKYPENHNNFHFLPSYLENLEFTCRVKKINGINIVHEIKQVRGIHLPFSQINMLHSGFVENNSDSNKKQDIIIKESRSLEVDLENSGYNPSKSPKTTLVDVFPIKLKEPIIIKRVKKASDSSKTSTKKRLIVELKDLELLSVNNPQSDSHKTLLNIEAMELNQAVNIEQIPDGLHAFAKSIDILAKVLKINVSHKLIELPGISKCSYIEGQKRKLMIATLYLTPTYFVLEVDSSNERLFSTLLIRSQEVPDFNLIADKIPECGCTWPVKVLNEMKIMYVKLKHPYIKGKKIFNSESEKTNFKIIKHARNILITIRSL